MDWQCALAHFFVVHSDESCKIESGGVLKEAQYVQPNLKDPPLLLWYGAAVLCDCTMDTLSRHRETVQLEHLRPVASGKASRFLQAVEQLPGTIRHLSKESLWASSVVMPSGKGHGFALARPLPECHAAARLYDPSWPRCPRTFCVLEWRILPKHPHKP
jgi:hypothetical protein